MSKMEEEEEKKKETIANDVARKTKASEIVFNILGYLTRKSLDLFKYANLAYTNSSQRGALLFYFNSVEQANENCHKQTRFSVPYYTQYSMKQNNVKSQFFSHSVETYDPDTSFVVYIKIDSVKNLTFFEKTYIIHKYAYLTCTKLNHCEKSFSELTVIGKFVKCKACGLTTDITRQPCDICKSVFYCDENCRTKDHERHSKSNSNEELCCKKDIEI